MIRQATPEDYDYIISSLNDWWDGRQMVDMLPRLFFEHFGDTSFVAEIDGRIAGFITGFLSQQHTSDAYIHFAGVDPEYRGHGIARSLYERFFSAVTERGRTVVKCVTSPVNGESVAFHRHMGFTVRPGDAERAGVQIHENHDGPGQDRVLFMKNLPA
jgi:ribosomal protein S18 acetylase RimI-like enzyme